MDKTNFFLASAAVIPVLALTSVVSRSVRFETVSDEATKERDVVLRWAHSLVVLAVWVLTGWAEFICLRQLETGHAPFPGAGLIWVAIIVLTIPTVTAQLDWSPGEWLVNLGFRLLYRGRHPDRDVHSDD